jgi:hypothetical protein
VIASAEAAICVRQPVGTGWIRTNVWLSVEPVYPWRTALRDCLPSAGFMTPALYLVPDITTPRDRAYPSVLDLIGARNFLEELARLEFGERILVVQQEVAIGVALLFPPETPIARVA